MRALAAACAAVFALVAFSGPSQGASTAITVTANVPSSIALTNNCLNRPSWSLGSVLPGASSITSTTTPCTMSFQSSNDTAMLQVMQSLGTSTAMVQSGGNWANQRAAPWTPLTGVSAFDVNKAAAIGPFGPSGHSRIYTTTTGPGGWTLQNCVTCPDTLTAISIARNDATKMYAVGDGCEIWKSTTSGVSWTAQTKPAGCTDDLTGVVAVTDQTVYATGLNGRVIRTLNGGSTAWTSIGQCTNGAATNFVTISAPTATDLWVGGGLISCRTANANGGSPTWNNGTLNSSDSGISALSSTTAWSATGYEVCKTTDGGVTWPSCDPVKTTTRVDYVVAVDANNIIAVGDRGTVWRTSNGGTSWTRSVATGNDLTAVAASDGTHIWSVGFGYQIASTTDGLNWSSDSVQANVSSLLDIDSASGQVAWVVGGAGQIMKTVNGGGAWTPQASGTTKALRRVDAVDANNVWAVGDDGTILKTTDGGATWTSQSSGTTNFLWGVSATNPYQAWAVGQNGTILATTNGGTSWTSQNSGTTAEITGIYALSTTNAIAVTAPDPSSNGLILRTTNGGATWNTVFTAFAKTWGNVHGSGQTLWAVGRYNTKALSTDGGATWTQITTGGNEATDVAVLNADIAYFGDSSNYMTVTYDGGATFTSTTDGASGINDRAYGFDALDVGDLWMVGPNGGIGRSTAPATVSDYGGANNWSGAGTTNMFGACLQNVSGTTTPVWTKDASGVCTASDTDTWYAIPTVATKIAKTTVAGDSGSVDMVWGFRAKSSQPAGTYAATVTFIALAPDV